MKLGVVIYDLIPALERQSRSMKLKVIFGYILDWRPAWDTWDLVSEDNEEEEEEEQEEGEYGGGKNELKMPLLFSVNDRWSYWGWSVMMREPGTTQDRRLQGQILGLLWPSAGFYSVTTALEGVIQEVGIVWRSFQCWICIERNKMSQRERQSWPWRWFLKLGVMGPRCWL